MAATLGGMMRAPMMAVVFAFELTHDANALLPLLAAAAVAYGFTVLTMRRSILTEKIARRGHHIYREYGIDPLERHSVAEVMSAQVPSASTPPRRWQTCWPKYFGAAQRHRAYPVLRDGAVIGMLDRDALEAAGAGEQGRRSVRRQRAGGGPAWRNLPRRGDPAGRARTRTPAGGGRRRQPPPGGRGQPQRPDPLDPAAAR